jgi:uncharacterized protein
MISQLNLEGLSPSYHNFFFKVTNDALGNDISIPLMIIKGKKKGPTVCLNSLIHGDELNGLEVIHDVIKKLDKKIERGTLITIPVFNVPGFLKGKRHFSSGVDLNHIMPGKKKGKVHDVYVNRIIEKIISKSDYLLDLHTAREGSRNSYYIRADLSNKKIENMANLISPDLVLDHIPTKTTLRGHCATLNIPAVTLEIGDPLKYQKDLIDNCSEGIIRLLTYLKMTNLELKSFSSKTIICNDSKRLISDMGGLVEIYPKILEKVKEGQVIGRIKDIFAKTQKELLAPISGVVLGKLINPVIKEGDNLIHIGKFKR